MNEIIISILLSVILIFTGGFLEDEQQVNEIKTEIENTEYYNQVENEEINEKEDIDIDEKFIKPVEGRISSYYGPRWDDFHYGIDIAVPIGTPIKATKSGKIILSEWVSGYGKTVVIEHRKGLRTLYAHNHELLFYGGQYVKQGEIIALSGNTGRSTGPHLHFEIQIDGQAVNPLDYLK